MERLVLYGFACLLVSSIGCFFLGIIFIVDAAGIDLIGINEPPYHWDYISAGIYNLICSIIGIISTIYSISRAGLIVPIVGTSFMLSGAMLEFILLEWSINVIIILFCIAYLTIAYRIHQIRTFPIS